MTRENALELINNIFRKNFYDDSIVVTEQTTAEDIPDWDSLEHINLINEIEKRFQMQFKMKEITGMQNVGEMLDIILERTPL